MELPLTNPLTPPRRRGGLGLPLRASAFIACWLAVIVGGMYGMWLHGSRAGAAAATADQWPGGDALPRSTDQPTLVMVLHAQCPCSRASLGELETLTAGLHGRLHSVLILTHSAEEVARANLLASAARDAGIILHDDRDGSLAARFAAATSGQAYLYDVSGQLLFSGGLTASRGHRGANEGTLAIEAILQGREPTTRTSHVFGCSLW